MHKAIIISLFLISITLISNPFVYAQVNAPTMGCISITSNVSLCATGMTIVDGMHANVQGTIEQTYNHTGRLNGLVINLYAGNGLTGPLLATLTLTNGPLVLPSGQPVSATASIVAYYTIQQAETYGYLNPNGYVTLQGVADACLLGWFGVCIPLSWFMPTSKTETMTTQQGIAWLNHFIQG